MTKSLQTVSTGRGATGAADRAGEPGDHEDSEREGPEPGTGDDEFWPALPRAFADGVARRALLRDLALRALI